MLSTNLTERYLDAAGTGWAFLDKNLKIVRYHPRFISFLSIQNPIQDRQLMEVMPEAIGLDASFESLISGKKTSLAIPHVEREDDQRRFIFLNLDFISTGLAEEPILCTVTDDTELALTRQKIQQQTYEMRLLKSLLSSRQQEMLAGGMIGHSAPIERLRSMIGKVASVPFSTILLYGETGTGKNLAARMIHLSSKSSKQPFVEFNCAAVPESLLESELFGHEKGAFTHAISQKKGLLESANQGTLFLDEIGDLPLNLQAKLLTVLESRKFRRLGSTVEIETRFRLITATHRDLPVMIHEGRFREDLYYRIQVVTLTLPSLKETGRDILEIAMHFINVYNHEFGKSVQGLSEASGQKLLAYAWPGNVRELRNVIERAMIFSEHPVLMPEELQLGARSPEETYMNMNIPLRIPDEGMAFEALEKEVLEQALNRCGGNQSKAARLLQMSRDTFRYRLEKHGLL